MDPRTLGIACVFLVLLALPFALGNYGHYILATVMIRSQSATPASGRLAPTARLWL
jgi:hypothetical protein